MDLKPSNFAFFFILGSSSCAAWEHDVLTEHMTRCEAGEQGLPGFLLMPPFFLILTLIPDAS